jgi:hypothetical protein
MRTGVTATKAAGGDDVASVAVASIRWALEARGGEDAAEVLAVSAVGARQARTATMIADPLHPRMCTSPPMIRMC